MGDKPGPPDEYSGQSLEQTLETLGVDKETGLGTQEAEDRLRRYGFNEIQEKEEPLWHRLFRRFWGPIPWMIEAAAALSAAARKWQDFAIIGILLLVNVALDFFQERRALSALQALKGHLAKSVTVRRDGSFKRIPARELVPGDVFRLRLGDIVPADGRLLEGDYLLLDQSSLTGESLPVGRKPGETAYANTIVKQGEMLAVAIRTAMRTRFSAGAALVAEAQRQQRSHFQGMMIRLGNFLIGVALALILLITALSLWRGDPPLELLRFALVLMLAAIPVAMPAVLSVTLAVGAMNLARQGAIVSRLAAIEELAGTDVLCSDKTGTLTKNEMRVAEPVALDGFTERDLFIHAALASRPENMDPIEQPIFRYLEEKMPDAGWQEYRQANFRPFDPVRKSTEADVEGRGERFHAVKGAPQVVLRMARPDPDRARGFNGIVDRLAAGGYRTLAVAGGPEGGPLDMIGLIPLYDPPREDSRRVIEALRDYGVKVKMVTGDNLAIARETGRRLGLEGMALRAGEFSGTDAETIGDAEIFAEVAPEDKYRIVEALQRTGHFVAMTGDGVNDAPALKKADCGFAVSNATDAARAAADVVLTLPGLSVIREAIRQARVTFARMQSYAAFRVAETIRIVLFMTFTIAVFGFYPLSPRMIILLALLNDIPILAIAYDNTGAHPSPVRWRTAELLSISTTLGVMGVASSFALFFLLQEGGFPEDEIRTFLFLKLIIAGHSTLYLTRARDWFWRRPRPSPPLWLATFGTEVLGTVFAAQGILVAPIGWAYAAGIWAYALAWFVLNDVVKRALYRVLSRGTQARSAISRYTASY